MSISKNILDIVVCPKCKQSLEKNGNSLVCFNKHCYDMSKEGYINFLLANAKKSKDPGDDQLMINARDMFLSKGYFDKLRDEITRLVNNYDGNVVLDAGCGTGYYSKNLKNKDIICADISKHAVKRTAKNNEQAFCIVSSIFDLPIKDKSVDIVLNIFAPKPNLEFKRVLKDDGVILEVVPAKEHLKELKSLMYNDFNRPNVEKYAFGDFSLIKSERIGYSVKLKDREDVINLLKMTPYWYKGGEKYALLDTIPQDINVTFDFIINVWKV